MPKSASMPALRLPLVMLIVLVTLTASIGGSSATDRAKFRFFTQFGYGVYSGSMNTIPMELTHQLRQVIVDYDGEGREALEQKVRTKGKQWIIKLSSSDAYFTDGKLDLDSFARKYESEFYKLRNNREVFGFLIADDPFGFEGGKRLTRDQLSQVYEFFARNSDAVMFVNFVSLDRGRRELGPEYLPDRGCVDIALVGYRSGSIEEFLDRELKELERLKGRPVSEPWQRTPVRLAASMRVPAKLESTAAVDKLVADFDKMLVNTDLNGFFWDGWEGRPGRPGLLDLRLDEKSEPFVEVFLRKTDEYVEDELNYRRGITPDRRRYSEQ